MPRPCPAVDRPPLAYRGRGTNDDEGPTDVDEQTAIDPDGATPEIESPEVDVLDPLESLSDRPLAEHPDVYQGIHTALQQQLADIDNA
jgi:hypothetical protein